MATGVLTKVLFDYGDGNTYEILAHTVTLSYEYPKIYHPGSDYIIGYGKTPVGGTITFEFKSRPVIHTEPKIEQVLEIYFGDQVEFIFDGKITRCNLADGSSGTASCNPNDKYNKDYGKLLSYQRAKDRQLYGR